MWKQIRSGLESLLNVRVGVSDGTQLTQQSSQNPLTDILTSIKDTLKDIGDVLSNLWTEITEGLKKGTQAAIVWALDKMDKLPKEEPAALGGHSRSFCNYACAIMVGALLVAALIGYLVDCLIFPVSSKGRTGAAVLFSLVVSYALLLPAIMTVLFSFNLYASFTLLGVASIQVNLTRENDKPAAITESMWQLISTLWDTGGYLGAVLVVIYAMVVPALKLMLLFFGEWWRNSKDESRVLRARRCIQFVQFISKWASPDMFAYILMLHLFRDLNNPPVLQAKAVLDVGFIAFCLFCISSTISTLGIKLPTVADLPGSIGEGSISRPVAARPKTGSAVPMFLLTAGFFCALHCGHDHAVHVNQAQHRSAFWAR